MKRALLISGILCAQTVFAADKVQTIRHENCKIVSSLLTNQEVLQKGYTRASFDVVTSRGTVKFTDMETSDLVGPFHEDENRKKTTQNELESVLKSLHVSKAPKITYYSADGKKLNLSVDKFDSPVLSAKVPRFPLDNSEKMYFEVSVSVDKASIKEQTKYWVYLNKTPVAENVVFRSKVFSFSEVAAAALAKGGDEGTDEALKILAKNDPQEMAEIAKDESSLESLNFMKMILVEYVRNQEMGESTEAYLELLKSGVPSCEVAK